MTAIDGLMKFQIDRKLHERPYDWSVEATNIVEELIEALGVNDRNVAILSVGDMQLRVEEKIKQGLVVTPSIEEQVDAFGDVIVFAVGAITKLGYNPEDVLEEIGKEINSRVGQIIDGKFVKDKSVEAKSQWYKADFSNAKLTIVSEKQRKTFYAAEGYMGTDKEVSLWVKSLTNM